MIYAAITDDRRLEIENAVNRCHRRCRIVNVRDKAAVQMQYVAFVPYEPPFLCGSIPNEPCLSGTNWLFNLFRHKK